MARTGARLVGVAHRTEWQAGQQQCVATGCGFADQCNLSCIAACRKCNSLCLGRRCMHYQIVPAPLTWRRAALMTSLSTRPVLCACCAGVQGLLLGDGLERMQC